MEPVYLDYNASTPVDSRVLEAMLPYYQQDFGNASSVDHAWGWRAKDAIEAARNQVAELINAAPHEIFFTSGATEAIYLAMTGLATAYQHRNCCVYYSDVEHESVRQTLERLTTGGQLHTHRLPVDANGIAISSEVKCQDASSCVWLAQMAVNHELGTRYDFGSDGHARLKSSGVNLFCDLTQAVGKTDIDVKKFGIDLGVFSSHKMYGPLGAGALYIRGGVSSQIIATVFGPGSQEQGVRAGTLNVPAIVGFGKACEIARSEMAEESARIVGLRNEFEQKLLNTVSDLWINAYSASRVCNTANVGIRGLDARALIRQIGTVGCSTRSACSSSSQQPSSVLKAIGLSDDECFSCIRFSLGRFTTAAQIEYAAERIARAVSALRRS